MVTIPGKRKPRIYERKAIVEGLAIVPPLVTGIVAAKINYSDPAKKTLGLFLFGGAAWLVIASIIKVMHAHSQDREQKHKQDYDGLRAALRVVFSAIARRVELTDHESGMLRITMHRVVPSTKPGAASEELEQLVPYVGGPGGRPGRKFSIRSGIIGKAVREKAPLVASRRSDDYDKFVAELIRDWAFTETDAREVRPDRRAWMAVPILGRHASVVGVVFLDSSDADVFREEIREIVVDACVGIASYIDETY